MTYPVDAEPASSRAQGPGAYPDGYPAVRPEAVAPYNCNHDDNDASVCVCVHDWRISWGNLPKKTSARATYIQ